MTKNILVFWWLRNLIFFLIYFSGNLIKRARCMPPGLIFFSKCITLAFHRDDVKNFRARNIFQILQRINELSDVVTVNRTEITQLQSFKQVGVFIYEAFDAMFQLTCHLPGKILSYR